MAGGAGPADPTLSGGVPGHNQRHTGQSFFYLYAYSHFFGANDTVSLSPASASPPSRFPVTTSDSPLRHPVTAPAVTQAALPAAATPAQVQLWAERHADLRRPAGHLCLCRDVIANCNAALVRMGAGTRHNG